MSFAVYYFQGGIVVASGDAAATALSARVQSALVTGEAAGFLINSAKGVVPHVGVWNDVNFVGEVTKAWLAMDANSIARETLASVMGTLAGLYALPNGPATALAADMIASEAFKSSYDKVTEASQNHIPWADIFDGIDDIIYWAKYQVIKNPGADGAEGNPFNKNSTDQAVSKVLGTTPDPLVKTIRYVDPLILDLDGDGLEITPPPVQRSFVRCQRRHHKNRHGLGWC